MFAVFDRKQVTSSICTQGEGIIQVHDSLKNVHDSTNVQCVYDMSEGRGG